MLFEVIDKMQVKAHDPEALSFLGRPKRVSGKTMEAERLSKPPVHTDKSTVTFPALRRALLTALCCCCRGLKAAIKPSWQLWSVWPGPHAHSCPCLLYFFSCHSELEGLT